MKKYQEYTKEELLKVIINKNKTINKLNGQVYYYKKNAEYQKEKYRKEKKKLNKIKKVIEDFIKEFDEHPEYCKNFDDAKNDMQFYDAGRYECLMEIKKQIDNVNKKKGEKNGNNIY